MKKSRGFILVQDMIIFLLCSLLLLSAGNSYKMALFKYQQSLRLTEGWNRMEAYFLGAYNTDISIVISTASLGNMVELQLWEDNAHEKMVCNMFFVEQ